MTTLVKADAMSGLLGSWTFTKTMEASHYYDVKAWVVLHFMRDPLSVLSCQLKDCKELDNQVCQRQSSTKQHCVDTESNIVEWSDVSMLMQFGWEVSNGYIWQSSVQQNTSDWLGPYNLVLAQDKNEFAAIGNNNTSHVYAYKSRYVQTAATSYLQPPVNISVIGHSNFDHYAGPAAVQSTIESQATTTQSKDDDPYEPYKCPSSKNDHHNNSNNQHWTPLLPTIQLFPNATAPDKTTLYLKLDFDLFAFANKNDPLFKEWPTLQKHFSNDIYGPYCGWNSQDESQHGFAIRLHHDTSPMAEHNNTWQMYKGCPKGHHSAIPCWFDTHGNRSITPSNDDNDGACASDDPLWLQAFLNYGAYVFLVAFCLAMAWNCQLHYKVKRMEGRRRPPHEAAAGQETMDRQEDPMQEPLLPRQQQQEEEEDVERVETADP